MALDTTKRKSFEDLGRLVSQVLTDSKSKIKVVINKTSESVDSAVTTVKSKTSVLSDYITSDYDGAYEMANAIYNTFSNKSSSTDDTTKVNSSSIDVSGEDSKNIDFKNMTSDIFGAINAGTDYLANTLRDFAGYVDTSSSLGQAFSGIVSIVADGLKKYEDGVSETSFGAYMSDSWYGNGDKSFLDFFKSTKSSSAYNVKVLSSTPLDPGKDRESLYGSMILGCPYQFNSIADPGNRTLINSLIKDSRYLSLTPGMPQYHGSQYLQKDSENIYKQTTTGNDMLNYLLRNGIDKTFASKDKRYYTFQAKYAEYFSYLEAMLNPIWIKMGLATGTNQNEFNIFSFFNIQSNSGIDPTGYNELLPQYNHSIGFYVNPASAVSESVDSSQTSEGSALADRTNSMSDTYQKINYITGMGTGGGARNTARTIGIGYQTATNLGNYISENFTMASKMGSAAYNAAPKLKALAGLAGTVAGAAIDVARLSSTEDLGSLMQSFATTNGMKVVYPELWNSSTYSKNINFNLTFTSPYGDPLSIFKYVYVPFCALLCFALPRQAAENGFVSPFFVRADVPGVVTSDLALISSLTWTKGGSNNLWTKDGLPRSIDCSITITDLYPYLAMTKRFSFLSANPSYTVFLDNMAGMCAISESDDSDSLNKYFDTLVDRVSGEIESTGLWNKYNTSKRNNNKDSLSNSRKPFSNSISFKGVPWMHNSSPGS